jgi:FkbM family methyltransferase
LYEFKEGIRIPLLTLEQIIRENQIEPGAFLKMDCEGCEYDVILSTPSDVLKTLAS